MDLIELRSIDRGLKRFAWLNTLRVKLLNYTICEYNDSGKYFIRKGRFFIKYFNEHVEYKNYRWCPRDRFLAYTTDKKLSPLYKDINAVGRAWDEHILCNAFTEKVIYVVRDDE